jgi:hypothetical protein
MKIEKTRLMELSGFNKGHQPLLMLESGQPIYAYDLAEMIQQEMRKVMQEMQIRKAENDIIKAQATRSASAAMGFTGVGFANHHMPKSRPFYGAGGTRGFLGQGFR